MSKSTFKILFYIRKNQVNKEGKSGIMIRLTDNGEIVHYLQEYSRCTSPTY